MPERLVSFKDRKAGALTLNRFFSTDIINSMSDKKKTTYVGLWHIQRIKQNDLILSTTDLRSWQTITYLHRALRKNNWQVSQFSPTKLLSLDRQTSWAEFIFIFTWEVVKTSRNNACPSEGSPQFDGQTTQPQWWRVFRWRVCCGGEFTGYRSDISHTNFPYKK